MKICIIQPEYSKDYSKSDIYFEKELELLAKCDPSMDLICLPESCDVPALADKKEDMEASSKKYNQRLIESAKETAKRCNSLVFFNARSTLDGKLRNTTYCISRQGEIVGRYYKQHLVPSEVYEYKLGSEYSFEFSEPTVVEIEGIRFAFLTCYDFYFYEAFSNIARQNVDIIIGCSHQRSDTALALRIFSQNIAYNTNSYVIRSSVSMGVDSKLGGCSMVVAPTGEVLVDMFSEIGMKTVEIDPKAKYYKPAGFGNPPAPHYEYIEKGRRPWKYRPGGSAIVPNDEFMAFPRVCSCGGLIEIAPKNTLPSFGSAISLGCEEISFDLYKNSDGVLTLSNEKSPEKNQFKTATFEEILKKFSCHAIMNIRSENEADIDEIYKLIFKYDCLKYVYFTSDCEELFATLLKRYPSLPTCFDTRNANGNIIETALKYNCKKLLLTKENLNAEIIKRAHENGISCAVSADTPKEAEKYLSLGIDTLQTNEYMKISPVVAKRKKYHLNF